MPTYLLDHVSDSYQFILVKSCDCLKSHSIICVNNGRKKWISGIREMTRHINVQCTIFNFSLSSKGTFRKKKNAFQ